jgi:hypothetical protein
MQVTVRNRAAAAVQVTLPGEPVERLEIAGISPAGQAGRQTLALDLRNTGTVMLKPAGTLRVADRHGQPVREVELKLDTLLPEVAIEYPVFLADGGLGPGDYRASVVLAYGAGREARYEADVAIGAGQAAQAVAEQPPLAPPPAAGTGAPMAAPADVSPLLLVALGAGGMLAVMLVGLLGALAYRRHRPA